MACSLGIWAERLAYLAISDLLSGPECGMTARESPQRLETCLHLCISHINKFSHRCIQTSLSALLHTTHSCHKHSDTQSTTSERGKGRGREKGKKGKKGGRRGQQREMEERRRRDGSSVGGECRDENVERRASAPKQCLALCLVEQEPRESRKTTSMDEREWGSSGMRNRQGQEWGAKGCKHTECMKY